jgi:HlyD family secretion protein
MTASVDILTTRKANVLSVPLAAVTTRKDDDKQGIKEAPKKDHQVVNEDDKKKQEKKLDKVVVFVNDKGTAKMVEVKTGISDYDNIEIISGLSDSTQIVTGPFLVVSKRLKEGDKIKELKKTEEKKVNN